MGRHILLVGSGGREHALAWKLAQSPLCERITVAPGNPGIARIPKTRVVPIKAESIADLVALAVRDRADLVVCGPESALVAGLGDAMLAAGIAFFGPIARRRRDRRVEGLRQEADGRRWCADRRVRGVRRAWRRRGVHRRATGRRGDQGRWPVRRQGGGGHQQRRRGQGGSAPDAVGSHLRRRGRARGDRGAPLGARGLDDGGVRRHALRAARFGRGSQGGWRRRRRSQHRGHGDLFTVAADRRRAAQPDRRDHLRAHGAGAGRRGPAVPRAALRRPDADAGSRSSGDRMELPLRRSRDPGGAGAHAGRSAALAARRREQRSAVGPDLLARRRRGLRRAGGAGLPGRAAPGRADRDRPPLRHRDRRRDRVPRRHAARAGPRRRDRGAAADVGRPRPRRHRARRGSRRGARGGLRSGAGHSFRRYAFSQRHRRQRRKGT